MQRDKRGRFVKKAQAGSALSPDNMVILKGRKYKVKPGASQAFTRVQANFPKVEDWLNTSEGLGYLEFVEDVSTPSLNLQPLTIPNIQPKSLNTITSGLNTNSTGSLNQTPQNNGIGNGATNPASQKTNEQIDEKTNPSAGMTFLNNIKNGIKEIKPIDKTKLASFLELTRAGIGAGVNNKIAERALASEKPLLQDVSEIHRPIYGDYRAKVQGEKSAAQLSNMASRPLTSDGALQSQMQMEAAIKGQEYIEQGRAKDDALIRQTNEVAWQQEKENQQHRHAVAMQNRQALLMTEKNKSQIENMRDSANYSQVWAPWVGATEQRLRSKAAQQEYYQDYYDDALVQSDVYANFRDGLSPTQKALIDTYQTSGIEGVSKYLADNKLTQNDWIQTQRLLNNEVIRRRAAIKGAWVNPTFNNTNSGGMNFTPPPSIAYAKHGGTVYRTRLRKRSKDNDRASKSIESSKKLAARFLEKAMDSLYNYTEVELIAKPKRKRKYQAGGGLPFVNFTPVFATSEAGAPKSTTKADTEAKNTDLTTKDILKLLEDVEGLPSDIEDIQTSLSNFVLTDQMDPLGLDSSSSIASRYISLIGKIKKAKTNRDWFNKAYDKLSADGALNEYAVDSTGHFIGMDASGEFARFTAKQVADGEVGNYQILTNSNLLDIRARYPDAAFNSNLIMEAANGVSMNQITEHISKVVQGLGSDKNQTQIFGDQSKEVLAGLRQLQQAAQQVGQDLSISDLYEASIFTETQAKQAELALNYIYQTMPTNMQALLFAKAKSQEGALNLINNLVNSKLSSTTKLEFSPKNQKETKTSSSKTGNVLLDGLELSPAQMLQQGFGERESILIQDKSSGGISVEAITMPITNKGGDTVGATTLEGVATSQYGGMLDFSNASMGGKTIPFEGRRNIAVDGSKIYSMYLPINQDEFIKGNIVPDIALIDKVNTINKQIKENKITDPNEINQLYTEAGLPVYLNNDGTVVPQYYRRFGVLNGTAIDNAFGKDFIGSDYLKEVDDEDIINGALSIMNYGRSKEDRIEYDAKNFFNFGGLLGNYDSVYQGTIFIPMSNDVFLGIAGSGKTITTTDANNLEAKQQQKQRVSATYVNPGQLR